MKNTSPNPFAAVLHLLTAMRARAAIFCTLGLLLLSFSATAFGGPAPTQADVEKALRGVWEKQAGTLQPKVTLMLNSVKFGAPAQATAEQSQVENIPAGATVTPALVDFTVRTFYDDGTQAVRRVREASVYQDSFGEWTVMTGTPRGQDQTTTEPAVR